jgi:PAS domain S-box-containing protein
MKMTEVTVETVTVTCAEFCEKNKIRVLHVDDDAEFLAVAKQCLEERGQFQVETAFSAEEALEKLEVSEYDAIVADYQMSGKNGLEFLRELRRRGNDAPFFLLTNRGKEEIAVEALNSGVELYVDKQGNTELVYDELKRSICLAVKNRRAEKLLRASEEKYRSLFVNMLNGFAYCKMIWDENGQPTDFVYLEVNDAFEKLTGLKKEAVLGKPVTEAIPGIKEAHPELFEIYGRVASTGEKELFEIYFKPLKIWLSISVYSPKKGYFVAMFENISERKKNITKTLFQARMLDAVRQTIIATDKDSIITYWNSAAEELHGWSEAEMKGQNISKIIPEDIAAELMAKVDSHLDAKESWSGEITTKRKDGTVLPIMVTISPIINDTGEFIGTVTIETDISEQKWMQEIFNEAIAKVCELNDMLQVVESLTRHDIRNKLAALNGRIFLLKKRLNDNSEALFHLKEMEQVAQQMLRILEFERIYVQVGAEEPTDINVEQSFAEAASLFSNLKEAKLINECHGLTVLADSLLRQLFYNLIDNSLKYGEKLTKIRLHYEEEESLLRLIYEDDGVGVSEEMKSRLFEKGFGKGTGYGLYLIKRICEAYGWTIHESGKEGQGAQFTMIVPKTEKEGKRSYKIGN